MSKNIKQKENRLRELEDQALAQFADKLDFCVQDWLGEADADEYTKLYKELNGYCLVCGEEACDH